jgi:TonB-dependent receptor
MSRRSISAALIPAVSYLALAQVATAQTAPQATPASKGQSPAVQSSTVADVVVTAPRQENLARLRQENAPNLIQVQSADTIAKYPDFNAAESLGRIPGVSLSSDTGEGRFVNIRGLDANLNGATYGGVVLLNTNPGGTAAGGGGRAVEFDTIPTGAIDGIVVIYTGLPDHEAEGLGGQIDLTPRSAANITHPFFDGTIGEGDEPLHNHDGPFDAEVAFGARFGFDGSHLLVQGDSQNQPLRLGFFSNPTPFSFVLTGSTRQDRRGIDDLEEGYVDPSGTTPGVPRNEVSEYDLRRYDYHRRRFGYGGEFDFKPNDNHSWYVRADLAGYTEAVHKNFLLFKSLGGGPDATSPANPNALVDTTTPTETLTDEQENHTNQVYVLGGKDQFGDAVLDYHVAYSRATFKVNYNIGAKFKGPGGTPIVYDNRTNITYPTFSFPNGINLDNASLYKLSSLSNSQDADADEERTYAVNLFFPLHLINDNDRVKVGAQARIRDKYASEYDDSFNIPKLSLADVSGPSQNYYDGYYTNGPFINRYAIRNLVYGSALSGAPAFNYGSYFNDAEDIFAGYIQYTTQIGKLGILAGVRVENTQAKYRDYNVSGATPTPDTRTDNYTNAFPTVQLKYNILPKFLVRATFSTGIARPGFNQISGAVSIDQTSDPVLISAGNPNLKPTLGDNYDLDFEYYLPDGGIVQAGVFDKEFTNYIVPRIVTSTTSPFDPGVLSTATTYSNISSSYARGIQANLHDKFNFLPGWWSGFGLEANVTLVDSRLQEYSAGAVTGLPEYGTLPGTSRVTWNLAGFYERGQLETRLSTEYVSHSLFGLGGDKAYDTIQDARLTLDYTAQYSFNRHFLVYFNAKNLLNTPLRYYEGSSDLPIQREFYDVTVEGGFKVHY